MLAAMCRIPINVTSSNAVTLSIQHRASFIISIGLQIQPVLVSDVIF